MMWKEMISSHEKCFLRIYTIHVIGATLKILIALVFKDTFYENILPKFLMQD